MLRWWHNYFAYQHHIYLFWVPPTSHLLILQVERVDVILAGKDIAIVFWYALRCTEFLHFFQIFKFRNWNSNLTIFQQRSSKKNPTGISGIRNRIGIPLRAPGIGTKNQNSQPSFCVGPPICATVSHACANIWQLPSLIYLMRCCALTPMV